MLQKSVSTALMFGTYEQYKRTLLDRGLALHSTIIIAAFCAGCTEAFLTPFERIQTLMLDQKWAGQFKNTPHAFASLTKYGIKEYYRGYELLFKENFRLNV